MMKKGKFCDSFKFENLPQGHKPRTLLCCQYGVYAPTEEGVKSCGEPAVARCRWGGSEWFYTCKEHAAAVEEGETEMEMEMPSDNPCFPFGEKQ